MPSKQYLAKLEDRRRREQEHRRRKLYTALRTFSIPPGPLTYTVQFMNGLHTISELEYLWLKVRGHITESYNGTPIVTETHYIHLKEHHHGP